MIDLRTTPPRPMPVYSGVVHALASVVGSCGETIAAGERDWSPVVIAHFVKMVDHRAGALPTYLPHRATRLAKQRAAGRVRPDPNG